MKLFVLVVMTFLHAIHGQELVYSEDFEEAAGRIVGRLLPPLNERDEVLVWGVKGGDVEVKNGALNLCDSSTFAKVFLKIDYSEIFGSDGYTVSFDWYFNPISSDAEKVRFYAGIGDDMEFQDRRLAMGVCIAVGGIRNDGIQVIAGEANTMNQGRPSRFATAKTDVTKKAGSAEKKVSFAIYYDKPANIVSYYVDSKLIGAGEYRGADKGFWIKADHVDHTSAGTVRIDRFRIFKGEARGANGASAATQQTILKIGGIKLSL